MASTQCARNRESQHDWRITITKAPGKSLEPTVGVDRNTTASDPSKWTVRIISDKVKGASRPAANQVDVAFRACTVSLAGKISRKAVG